MKLKLTKAKIHHLLYLLEQNEREGWYFGFKEHYIKRHKQLKSDLEELETKEELKTK